MNLLLDPWIPVRTGQHFQHITYKELLCTDQPDLSVSLPRDDLEMACLQLLASLTQVIFIPLNDTELKQRRNRPLSEAEFDQGVKHFLDWFDLDHPQWPFMQTKGTKGEWTSIQKLMIGMPERTSKSNTAHAFFNSPHEIGKVCGGIAAIALYNQASNSPSFGGGFKGSLRGAGPVSTLVHDTCLRQCIWRNVLTEKRVRALLPWHQTTKDDDRPVWVRPMNSGKISVESIGLLRGLFWQPAQVELTKRMSSEYCDLSGLHTSQLYDGFTKSRMNYEIVGQWPHPYSPRAFPLNGDPRFISFTGDSPPWTQLIQYLYVRQEATQPGHLPAAVIAQTVEGDLNMVVGGYKVEKGALIVYRRHEHFSLPEGWQERFRNRIEGVIDLAIAFKEILVNQKVLTLVEKGDKNMRLPGVIASGGMKTKKRQRDPLRRKATTLYYQLTEPLIHTLLREHSLRSFVKHKDLLLKDLQEACMKIFEMVTAPYAHKPEVAGTIAVARERLRRDMNKLVRENSSNGGPS